jgi:hypothetical protein
MANESKTEERYHAMTVYESSDEGDDFPMDVTANAEGVRVCKEAQRQQGILGNAPEEGWNISGGGKVLVQLVKGVLDIPQRTKVDGLRVEINQDTKPFASMLASELADLPAPTAKARSPSGDFPSKNQMERERRERLGTNKIPFVGPLEESLQKCWDANGQPPPGSTAPGFLEKYFPQPLSDERHDEASDHSDGDDYCSGSNSNGLEEASWTYYDALNHVDHLRLAAVANPSGLRMVLSLEDTKMRDAL